MKHTIYSLFITLAVIFSFSACKKDTTGLGTMTAMINSDEFTAATCSITRTGNDWYSIKGNTSGSEHINIFLKTDNLATTTYTLDDTLTTHQASYYDGTNQHTSSSGTVTITSINSNKVSGTFIFRNVGTGVIVTNGVFTAVF